MKYLRVALSFLSFCAAAFALTGCGSSTARMTTPADPLKPVPSVSAVTPAANATCVSPTAAITIAFSGSLDTSTLNANDIVIAGPGNAALAAQMSFDSSTNVLSVMPVAPLPSGLITVTVQNIATSAGGVLASAYSWSFSTACTHEIQFQAPILDSQFTAVYGQVTVDTQGNTTIQLTGAAKNASFPVFFSPAVIAGAANSLLSFNLTTVVTDANGNGSSTVMFPQSGNWAGDFYLNGPNGVPAYETWLAAGVSGETYQALLLDQSTVNEGTLSGASQPTSATGTMSYSNSTLQFTVTGAAPRTIYGAAEIEGTALYGSAGYSVGDFTTDASGNGSLACPLDPGGGDLFQVSPEIENNPPTLISGFTVPG